MIAAAGDIACDPASPTFNNGVGIPALLPPEAELGPAAPRGPGPVLVPGDLQYEDGTLPQFMASFDPSWGRAKPLISPVPGNHEYNTRGRRRVLRLLQRPGDGDRARPGERGKGYYSFNVGSWHVVALNSECANIGGCGADSPQVRWLRADLAANPRPCTLAYWHGPRFTSGRYGDKSEDVRALFDAAHAGGVDVVLNGHEHFYERFGPQDGAGRADPARGVRQFIVGIGRPGAARLRDGRAQQRVPDGVGDRGARDDAPRRRV